MFISKYSIPRVGVFSKVHYPWDDYPLIEQDFSKWHEGVKIDSKILDIHLMKSAELYMPLNAPLIDNQNTFKEYKELMNTLL